MIAAESPVEKPVSDLAGIGGVLRQGRATKGMTVEDAALELHLQVRQINALEKGEFGGFSSPAFVRGYLRACARLYGLDGDKLVGFYDALLPPPKIQTPAVLASSKKHVLLPGCKNKAAIFTYALVALIAVFSPVFWLGSHYWPEEFLYKANNALRSVFHVDGVAADASDVSAALNVVESVSPSNALAAPTLADNPVAASAENQSLITPGHDTQDSILHIEFIDDCWVQLKAHDGRVLHEKVHKKGEIFDLPVKAPLHLWFGRAAAVNVSYNGAVVPVPVKQGFQSAQFILGDELSSGEIE